MTDVQRRVGSYRLVCSYLVFSWPCSKVYYYAPGPNQTGCLR